MGANTSTLMQPTPTQPSQFAKEKKKLMVKRDPKDLVKSEFVGELPALYQKGLRAAVANPAPEERGRTEVRPLSLQNSS